MKRWLAAPVLIPDGGARARDRGTPQGSVVSPVLANLFLHWAFDAWMDLENPDCVLAVGLVLGLLAGFATYAIVTAAGG